MRIDLAKLYELKPTHDEMTLLGYIVFAINQEGYVVVPEDEDWKPVVDSLKEKGIIKVHGRNIRLNPTLKVEDE